MPPQIWSQITVLIRASPGQEKGATPPSVAFLRTDLESLVMGICPIMTLGAYSLLLNHVYNKVINRTLLAHTSHKANMAYHIIIYLLNTSH
jgi:hypothetical protein